MDGWDVTIWAFAGYIAVFTLVRFMNARRNKVLAELRDRAAAQAATAAPPASEAKK